jgi:hypothetical protein
MLSIKEAGRYANYLKGLISGAEYLLGYKQNYMKTTETHFKSKGNPEAQDETIEVVTERHFNCKANDLVYMISELIEEKLKLAMAMENAKNGLTIEWEENGQKLTLDAAIEYNKKLREFIDNFVCNLANVKTTVSKTSGVAYKMNAEGNQTSYRYDVDVKNEIDFDKDVVKDFYKKVQLKTDKISTLIDKAQTSEIVNFEPKYSVHDSLDDIIAAYETAKGIKVEE